jgi:hypothetical protein
MSSPRQLATTVPDDMQNDVAPAHAGNDADQRHTRPDRKDSATCGNFPGPLVLVIESDDLLRWALVEACGR